jgi:putative transposase
MNIARSTFYYWRKAASPGKDGDVIDKIEEICLEFPGYGYRRVTEQLQQDGKIINHKRVLRLMRESDLLCRARRRRVKTTNSKHDFPKYPNLIKDVVVSGMNQV